MSTSYLSPSASPEEIERRKAHEYEDIKSIFQGHLPLNVDGSRLGSDLTIEIMRFGEVLQGIAKVVREQDKKPKDKTVRAVQERALQEIAPYLTELCQAWGRRTNYPGA
jgi:hypothetical protein